MRLLVLNPNTTASMTRSIEAAARAVAAPGTEIVARTSTMGPASIEGYHDEAFAAPGVVAAVADGEAEGCAAAVVACFDDTGVDAARCRVAMPVIGICEAALLAASPLARRIAIVTTLARSVVPIEDLVARYGFSGRVRVHACDVPVLSLEDAGSASRGRLEAEIAVALDRGAEAVVLGCAGMARLADDLEARFGVPVVDGVAAGVLMAEALVRMGRRTSKRLTYAPALGKPYAGLFAPFAPGSAPPAG